MTSKGLADLGVGLLDALRAAHEALGELMRGADVQLAFRNPVLLAPSWHEYLRRLDGSQETAAMLDRLRQLSDEVRKSPWPLGIGPIDALYVAAKQGEIAQSGARELARAPEVSLRLSAEYVTRMAATAERMARDGHWKDGLALGRLVLDAVDARGGRVDFEQDEMVRATTLHWLDVVARALNEVPDPRLFHDARERGEQQVRAASGQHPSEEPGALEFGLGVLHLDPYVGGRTNNQYQAQIQVWRGRLQVMLAAEHTALSSDQPPMPEPLEALQQAEVWLQRAADLRCGNSKGRTLKAQLQALVWSRFVGGSPDGEHVERVAAEALALLKAPEFVGMSTDVRNMRDWFRQMEGRQVVDDSAEPARPASIPQRLRSWLRSVLRQEPAPATVSATEAAEQLLSTPLPEGLSGQKAQEEIDVSLQLAAALLKASPQQSFELWLRVRQLGSALDVGSRWQFFQQGLSMLHRAWCPAPAPSDERSLREAFQHASTATPSNARDRAVRQLAICLQAASINEEELALALLDDAPEIGTSLDEQAPELLGFVRGTLLQGAAVNRFNARDFKPAAHLYMTSAEVLLDCNAAQQAMDIVERVVDIALNHADEAIAVFVVCMHDVGPRLELAMPGAAEHLQRLYRQVLASMMKGSSMSLLLFQLFLGMAKGAAFARTLLGNDSREWLNSEEAHALEAKLEQLSAEADEAPASDASAFTFDQVLTSYVGTSEQSGGTTPQERLRNLRILFESRMAQSSLMHEPSRRWIDSEDAIQAALGERSALLSLYFGQDPHGNACVYLLLLTSEQTQFACGQLAGWHSNLMTLSHGGQQISQSPFALGVAALRQAIQEEPLIRVVSPAGARLLREEVQQMLGGGIWEALAALRQAGKHHLYIWPHGPYHFAPFHLFGPEDKPLAQDWNVTYLPNLSLLDPARRWPAPQAEFIAVGVNFPEGNVCGLSPILDAETEALEVTAAMRAPRALIGPAATCEAVLEALRTHRRFHLATHGDLPVSNAAFQCLYLDPDAADKVLHAYEILRLDLRGVDLVTLSACETALGRLDMSDNLRGFTASLLTAGVSTIVGTLWPVETNCARHFFVRFYTALSGGDSKGDAFRAAQLSTRRQFAQYRDWGAFYLTGAID